jgi:HD-like signal output (HDOD) protein
MHSVGVAVLSDLLAQRTAVCYPEGAFIAGLLHDLGRLLIAISVPHEYAEIQGLYASNTRTLCDCETAVLELDHAWISSLALAAWNLPEPIQTAVRYHHQPDRDPTPAEPGLTSLSQMVFAVDNYINHSGNFVQPKSADRDEASEKPFLQLAGKFAEPILRDFDAEYEVIRKFF